jgi:hypothetical protein
MDVGIIIGTVIALVVLAIGLSIVNNVINGAAFTGTTQTVMYNIPIMLAIGGLVLAVGWAILK